MLSVYFMLCLFIICFIDGKFSKGNMFNLFIYSSYALRNGEENKERKKRIAERNWEENILQILYASFWII